MMSASDMLRSTVRASERSMASTSVLFEVLLGRYARLSVQALADLVDSNGCFRWEEYRGDLPDGPVARHLLRFGPVGEKRLQRLDLNLSIHACRVPSVPCRLHGSVM